MVREAGATLVWVAPDLPPDADASERHRRGFEPTDAEGVELVFACAPPEVNAAVAEACRARGVWVGRADAPDDGDFIVPARVRRGSVTLGLSSGVPAASSALVRDLEQRVPAGWGDFAAALARVRAATAGQPGRDAVLRRLASGALLDMLIDGDSAGARALIDAALSGSERAGG